MFVTQYTGKFNYISHKVLAAIYIVYITHFAILIISRMEFDKNFTIAGCTSSYKPEARLDFLVDGVVFQLKTASMTMMLIYNTH